ncbi:MAG: hypothetical protein A2509_00575 [Candidatus Edwardsbacteria bacterium RIFOXYD12_FULL_50_11]|nr:MAG: hypothetical protein A2502_00805 [Candidatus Edwardsbacteria bacterium RifOxyC12_full_54_24]OGF06207.1 MAG: hypothetical protein A2273_11630 [Candidatus Edwardsbacteria bacterium RifOxyA12_full_54_48]OGF12527.1 MAG: hypothetical protein A3K15_01640 [Candidatus Edwardsbacteria bacterium GWE2_54_12]OGF17634.1 MAG: hypothetical protein A2509_00575 [Candidatus Edwardsbacteria bacterium RIFOXYD12_FULL_50_11]OGJ18891.1 MAG: hypothetical protein A2349_11825 [Candidatus Edwardsbacteria bacteriu
MKFLVSYLVGFLFFCTGSGLFAQGFIDVEAGAAFTGYNDVQIPSDSGTRFSLTDEIVSSPAVVLRARGGLTMAGRHSIFILAAPLTVRGSGTLERDITFQGKIFRQGTEIHSTYRFDSYRLTYRYTAIDRAGFSMGAGLTAKIRSAGIALMSDSAYARRTDLGVVPLINLMVRYKMTEKAGLLLESDALWSPYGRAEDVLLAFQYSPKESHTLRIGYRMLEGGADGGGKVYTFSLFHYLTAGITVKF